MSGALLAMSVESLRVGLSVAVVQEIVDRPPSRPLPRAPAHLVGLACLRGAPLPLVDLGVLLSIGALPPREGRAVIAELEGGLRAGFLVSRVHGVIADAKRQRSTAPLDAALRTVTVGEVLSPDGVTLELDPHALFEVSRAC